MKHFLHSKPMPYVGVAFFVMVNLFNVACKLNVQAIIVSAQPEAVTRFKLYLKNYAK